MLVCWLVAELHDHTTSTVLLITFLNAKITLKKCAIVPPNSYFDHSFGAICNNTSVTLKGTGYHSNE